jgi:environmental stress-induced protein Ves
MRFLRAADRMARPWKNGGGTTRDVAAWPAGAGMDDFDWRISIAGVETSGPFSAFPGIDRVLMVIGGNGLQLTVAGMAPVLLDAASPPFAFPGEAHCDGVLTKGSIRDLNIMVRRGAWSARVRRLEVAGEAVVNCEAEFTLALALDAAVIGEDLLAAEDAVLAARGERLVFRADAARLVLAEIDRLTAL